MNFNRFLIIPFLFLSNGLCVASEPSQYRLELFHNAEEGTLTSFSEEFGPMLRTIDDVTAVDMESDKVFEIISTPILANHLSSASKYDFDNPESVYYKKRSLFVSANNVEGIRNLFDSIFREQITCALVLFNESEPIGTCVFQFSSERLTIKRAHVVSAHQGYGLFGDLLNLIESVAIDQGLVIQVAPTAGSNSIFVNHVCRSFDLEVSEKAASDASNNQLMLFSPHGTRVDLDSSEVKNSKYRKDTERGVMVFSQFTLFLAGQFNYPFPLRIDSGIFYISLSKIFQDLSQPSAEELKFVQNLDLVQFGGFMPLQAMLNSSLWKRDLFDRLLLHWKRNVGWQTALHQYCLHEFVKKRDHERKANYDAGDFFAALRFEEDIVDEVFLADDFWDEVLFTRFENLIPIGKLIYQKLGPTKINSMMESLERTKSGEDDRFIEWSSYWLYCDSGFFSYKSLKLPRGYGEEGFEATKSLVEQIAFIKYIYTHNPTVNLPEYFKYFATIIIFYSLHKEQKPFWNGNTRDSVGRVGVDLKLASDYQTQVVLTNTWLSGKSVDFFDADFVHGYPVDPKLEHNRSEIPGLGVLFSEKANNTFSPRFNSGRNLLVDGYNIGPLSQSDKDDLLSEWGISWDEALDLH